MARSCAYSHTMVDAAETPSQAVALAHPTFNPTTAAIFLATLGWIDGKSQGNIRILTDR